MRSDRWARGTITWKFIPKNLSFISSLRIRNSQLTEKHNSCSHFCSSIAIHAKKPTESWHKAVKNMSSHQKLSEWQKVASRFTEIVVKMWKCRRRFKLFVGLFVEFLDSLKQGTTGNWILMTQKLAPANSSSVCWPCWLCSCRGKQASSYIIWLNCTVMNLYSHSVLSLQTTLT